MAKTYAEQLAETEARLDAWVKAETSIASTGQSYSFSDGDTRRELTRAKLKEVHAMVVYLQGRVYRLERLVAGTGAPRIMHMRGI